MEQQRIEYIRKNGTNKGRKKGILWCGIDPDDDKSVIMGFTLCHSIDRYDFPGGVREAGFGMNLAQIRAEKYRFHTDYFVQKTFTEFDIYGADDDELVRIKNPDYKSIVEIPPSVMVRLKTFIVRCKKYYKDKEFPVWINKIEAGDSYPSDLLTMIPVDTSRFYERMER